VKFFEPDSGTIKLDGVDLREYDTRFLRENIGIVFQENHIFNGTIADNIRYAKPDATDEEVIRASKMAGAHDFIVKYPDGYNTQIGFGTSYFMVVINDMGEVLFETSINAIEPLSKNYLGKYDEALYEIAGSTSIEDNYFLTRYDGSHFLIQFVRGERSDNGGISNISNTRIVDCHSTLGLLSPFMLDFKDGSNITVTIDGNQISQNDYVYDKDAQSLKILTRMFDSNMDILDKMRQDRFLEILVTSGDESRTLRIELTKFSFDL
jgi:hypothetical protein